MLTEPTTMAVAHLRVLPDPALDFLEADSLEPVLYPDNSHDGPGHLELEDAWQALHFILNGSRQGVPPLDFLMGGGREVPFSDAGMGAVRAFGSMQVRLIGLGLQPLTEEVIRARFDAHALRRADVPPHIWDRPPTQCLDDYLLPWFLRLKTFVQRATAANLGMVVWFD